MVRCVHGECLGAVVRGCHGAVKGDVWLSTSARDNIPRLLTHMPRTTHTPIPPDTTLLVPCRCSHTQLSKARFSITIESNSQPLPDRFCPSRSSKQTNMSPVHPLMLNRHRSDYRCYRFRETSLFKAWEGGSIVSGDSTFNRGRGTHQYQTD